MMIWIKTKVAARAASIIHFPVVAGLPHQSAASTISINITKIAITVVRYHRHSRQACRACPQIDWDATGAGATKPWEASILHQVRKKRKMGKTRTHNSIDKMAARVASGLRIVRLRNSSICKCRKMLNKAEMMTLSAIKGTFSLRFPVQTKTTSKL